MEERNSYFDGGVFEYLVYSIATGLMIIITLGIGTPWAICFFEKWKKEHTVVEGKRLGFDGTGMGLLGKWIVWIILIILTLGIYSFFVDVELEKWKAKHTYFVD